MCDVGKELDNAANSVSNALGTDGSKNGLLNDPLSMAALAIATGAYYAPAGTLAAVADGATSVISATPAVVSSAASAVPWAAIGNGAVEVGKAALPVLLGSGSRQAQPYAGYQPNGTYVSISPNGTATAYPQPVQYSNSNAAPAGGSGMGLIVFAVVALLALRP